MFKKNYSESLRKELISTVRKVLTPVAQEYGYAATPLEEQIKWRPLVLILGNYSSGKSSIINEMLGAPIQETGQAPTDDSFTIIAGEEKLIGQGQIRCTSTMEGQAVLSDPELPFSGLARHGQRFAAHFRMKFVNSPFLKDLVIVDTPGMLDSVAEKDRGYNYQEVIGELAQIADLVIVMFDPHKAGTVRETYASLRETLPANTFEDRVAFVLNRVDECPNLADLLRVYGTLCWNLSQMTGRKDIPKIYTVYSEGHAPSGNNSGRQEYLAYLNNQKDALKDLISATPEYRLDHLAAYLENHGDRLHVLLQALAHYQGQRKKIKSRHLSIGLSLGFFTLVMIFAALSLSTGFGSPELNAAAGFLTGLVVAMAYALLVLPILVQGFHRQIMARSLTVFTPENQHQIDLWLQVEKLVYEYLRKSDGKFSLRKISGQMKKLQKECQEGRTEARKALAELRVIS